MAKYNKIATVKTNDSGGMYLALADGVKITVNGKALPQKNLNLQTPAQQIEGLMSRGYLTADQAQERLSKVPTFIHSEIYVSADGTMAGKSAATPGRRN